ncbi:hypothetical protein VTL71DRAFT_9434 [Oculimacula yallundae]|uniref:Uncharacterized protein n=1 Tax=Oculimacula yallundae TaxID=86028 RepID=A0ABR4BRX0_9HELO
MEKHELRPMTAAMPIGGKRKAAEESEVRSIKASKRAAIRVTIPPTFVNDKIDFLYRQIKGFFETCANPFRPNPPVSDIISMIDAIERTPEVEAEAELLDRWMEQSYGEFFLHSSSLHTQHPPPSSLFTHVTYTCTKKSNAVDQDLAYIVSEMSDIDLMGEMSLSSHSTHLAAVVAANEGDSARFDNAGIDAIVIQARRLFRALSSSQQRPARLSNELRPQQL